MFNTRDEAMEYLVKELISKGLLDKAAQEAEITKVVASIPPATRPTYGEDDVVAAANFWTTYNQMVGSAPSVPAASPINLQTTGGVAPSNRRAEYVVPVLAEEAMQAAKDILLQKQSQRVQNTAMTSVDSFIVRNPKASEMLQGLEVVPLCPVEKLDEYEANLVDTEENKAAFKRIKEAVIGSKKLPVHINDANRKVLGFKVTKPTQGEGKTSNESVTLTPDGLIGFLATEVLGRIPNEKNGIGCMITSIAPAAKAGRKADATAPQGKPRVKWVGKTAALVDPTEKHIVVANTYAVTGNKKETKKGRLRIADSFEVYNGTELNSKGKRKTKRIRLSGESTLIPVMKRLEDFVSKFGPEADAKTISANMSDADKAKALQITMALVSAATEDQLAGGTSALGDQFNNIISQIRKAGKEAGKSAVANFAD